MPQKKKKRKSPKVIDDAVIQDMKKCGATVNFIESEKLYGVVCTYGDEAWKAFFEWSEKLPENTDPQLAALFAPSINILNTALAPPQALGIPILNECNSIMNHLSGMAMEDFSPVDPAIGGIIHGLGLHVPFHHAKVAMGKVFEYIQKPPAQFGILNSLPSGSYICHVNQVWSNATVSVALFKP